jgi:hypothetical protein
MSQNNPLRYLNDLMCSVMRGPPTVEQQEAYMDIYRYAAALDFPLAEKSANLAFQTPMYATYWAGAQFESAVRAALRRCMRHWVEHGTL